MLPRQGLSRRRALAAAGLGLLASGGRAWAEGEEAHVLGAVGAEPGAAAMRRFADGLESVIQGRVRLALDATPAPDGAALLERLRGGQAAFGWVRVAEVQAVARRSRPSRHPSCSPTCSRRSRWSTATGSARS